MDKVRPRYKEVTKALTRGDAPDTFTRSLYRLSPYQGCGHGCLYCDGRAERYFVEGEFDADIVVRSNLPELLERELPRLREDGVVGIGSGTTDVYQPLEESERIVGRCAELLADANRPALIMTKSALVMKDAAAWSRLAKGAGFVLVMSVATVDEAVRSDFEPGASSIRERLETLSRFKALGARVGVLAMPVLPFISDDQDSIDRLYATLADIGVDWIMPGGLTLRPGRQKDVYLDTLRCRRPDQVERTLDLYAEERPSGAPKQGASRELWTRFGAARRRVGLPPMMPHRSFRELVPRFDELSLLFRDMLELYGERGADTGRLKAASHRYDSWLLSLRRYFRRHVSLESSWLGEQFDEAVVSGELARILDNDKLYALSERILAGACFDYRSLSCST